MGQWRSPLAIGPSSHGKPSCYGKETKPSQELTKRNQLAQEHNKVIKCYQLSWVKLATEKSLKADVSSFSPSSERFEELCVVCVFISCSKVTAYKYNMTSQSSQIVNWILESFCFLYFMFFLKILNLTWMKRLNSDSIPKFVCVLGSRTFRYLLKFLQRYRQRICTF